MGNREGIAKAGWALKGGQCDCGGGEECIPQLLHAVRGGACHAVEKQQRGRRECEHRGGRERRDHASRRRRITQRIDGHLEQERQGSTMNSWNFKQGFRRSAVREEGEQTRGRDL